MSEELSSTPRALSEAYKTLPKTCAYCQNCKEVFIDDIPQYGSILCPNGCGYALMRGLLTEGTKRDFVECGRSNKMHEIAIGVAVNSPNLKA
jgi:hypothetical protein